MFHEALNVPYGSARVALVPGPVKVLGDLSELYDEVVGWVLGPKLAAFFRQRRISADSSWPMMIRASEPPTNVRRLSTQDCS
jgi:hypothetical protein